MIANLIAGLIGNGAVAVGDYESLQTVTVGAGGQASISFTSIPTGYSHLQVRAIAISTITVDAKYIFNSDNGNNYSYHLLVGNGSSAAAYAATTQPFIKGAPFTSSTASNFGAGVVDILDYSNTNKNKTVRTLTGYDNNGSGEIQFISGAWYSTNAINSITITPSSGTTWGQYSSFALYGVK